MITAILAATLFRPAPHIAPVHSIPLALAAPQKKVTLRANVKAGEVLSGTRTFRVTVDTDEIVTQVEFYLNGRLQGTDDSTPYDFAIDTLKIADGDAKLRFVGYTSTSARGELELTVKIDNGLSKGADFHVDRGNKALANGNLDEAIAAGRVALQVTPGHVPARLLLARAFYAKNVLDEALNNAQEVLASDKDNLDALDISSAIQLRQAFNTFNRGGDARETSRTIRQALVGAATARRKALDARVDKFKVEPSNLIQFADLALASGRFSAAALALAPEFRSNNTRTDVGNRLAFAQIRMGRMTEARATIDQLFRFAKPDAYSRALRAIIQFESGDDAAATATLQDALLDDPSSLGVRTTQAFFALRRNRADTLRSVATDLEKDQGQRTEVMYYLSSLYNRQNRFQEARDAFQRAALAEPANAEAYIEQANEAVSIALNDRLEKRDADAQIENARSYFEVALIARPDSAQALTGMAIVAMLQNRYADAVKFGDAAVKANPFYAPGQYAYAGSLQRRIQQLQAASTNNRRQATQVSATNQAEAERLRTEAVEFEREASNLLAASQAALRRAAELDPNDLGGRQAPEPAAAYRYYQRKGLSPVITPPALG